MKSIGYNSITYAIKGNPLAQEIIQLSNFPAKLQEKLGTSALGTTYLVQHPKYGICTLKMLDGKIAHTPNFVKKFVSFLSKLGTQKELRFAGIYEIGQSSSIYILREYIKGSPFAPQGMMNFFSATNMIIEIAMALADLEQIGHVHKNLKPTNIIVTEKEHAYLVDVSLPPTVSFYLSPEQCEGKKSDIRSDIYSLGVIYYQCLAGKVPFDSSSGREVMRMHIEDNYADIRAFRRDLPKSLSGVLAKMLHKDPTVRYQTPDDVVAVLKALMRDALDQFPSSTNFFEVAGQEKSTSSAPQIVKINKENIPISRTIMMPNMASEITKKQSNVASPTPPVAKEFLLSDLPSIEEDISESLEHISEKEMEERLKEITLFQEEDFIKDQNFKRSFYFPATYQQKILESFQKTFHRECWLFKDLEDPKIIEIEVDFEQAIILKYLHQYEVKIQDGLKKLKENYSYKEKLKKNKEPMESSDSQYDFINTVMEISQVMDAVVLMDEDEVHTFKKEESVSDEEATVVDEIKKIVDSTVRKHTDLKKKEEKDSIEDKIKTQEDDEETKTDQYDEETKTQQGDEETKIQQEDDETYLPIIEDDFPVESNVKEELIDATPSIELSETSEVVSIPEKQEDSESTPRAVMLDENIDEEWSNALSEIQTHLNLEVDFQNSYQTQAWLKFVRENRLQKDVHFELLPSSDDTQIKTFRLNLEWLLDYEKKQDSISAVKDFFIGDYEINELGKGGMGVVLKLTTRSDATILSLRPENKWARKHFADVLQTRRGQDNSEIVYAEVPAQTNLVVKVAFKAHEESLIQEGKCLESVNQEPTDYIIGLLQQGRLMDTSSNEDYLGYYIMLEYASQGTADQLYQKMPENRLPIPIAFTIFYGMTQALLRLKEHGIIHRDIKPQNILLTADGYPRLSDFGIAISTQEITSTLNDERRRLLRLLDMEFLKISRQKEQAETKLEKLKKKYSDLQNKVSQEIIDLLKNDIDNLEKQLPLLREQEQKRADSLQDRYRLISAQENALKGQFAGSLFYATPEQFDAEAILTPQCDVYQLGAVMYTMFTGKRPVEGENLTELISQVLYHNKPKIQDHLPKSDLIDNLGSLISAMMINDPLIRITIEDVEIVLENILHTYADELNATPKYTIPNDLSEKSKKEYKNKIYFAQNQTKKAQQIIQKILQSKEQKFSFDCPECHKKLHVYRSMIGKQGNCPYCKFGPIIVQMPTNSFELPL